MSAASLRFAILGPLEVVRDGQRVEPDSPKLRTLLVDLLLHRGESRSADRLIDDLWSGRPPATANGVLQNYVSQLRKLLGADVVRRHGSGYLIDVGPDQVDRDRFVALAESAQTAGATGALERAAVQAREALDLWHGDALADVAGAGFAQAELVRLAELRSVTYELLFEAELGLGRHHHLVPALEAALVEQPLRERLWWLLMTALYRSGRQADALQAYQRARHLLVEELGIEPGPELRRLEQAVLRQRADDAPGRPRRRDDRPTMAGRDAERGAIHRFVEHSEGLLLLAGEPGIGKTFLLEDMHEHHRGLTVVGRGYEAERTRPYGPWVDALRSTPLPGLSTPLADGLAPLLPELGGTRSELDDPARLYDAVLGVLKHLAGRSSLLVVLDDLHWFDERSAALLHFVVRHLAGSVPVLASARGYELAENNACAGALESLRRDGLVQRLAVGPLPDHGVAELVHGVVPGADPGPITAASNGNPLFALEMARAVARGDDPMSAQVDALIGDRLARLSEGAAALVPWLAAFGRNIKPGVLGAVVGSDIDDLFESLGDLEQHGIVVGGQDGSYDFAHELVRDAAYRRLSGPRRLVLHGRIGRALSGVPDPDDTLAEAAAWHAERADDSDTCADASLRAARRCVRLLAYDEAAEHVHRGREHVRLLAPQRRVELGIRLVDVLLHPGLRLRDPALAAELADLCALARQLDMADELAEGLLLLSRVYHWGWGDIPRARALMQRAVELTSGARGSLVEPLLECARCLAYLEIDMPRTRELFDDLARLGELAATSHQYHWGRGLVLAWSGDSEDAADALGDAIRLAEARGDHWARFECSARLALLDAEAGRQSETASTLEELARRLGPGGSELAYGHAIRALSADDEDALDAAITELERIDARFLVPDLLGIAAERALRREDLKAAERYATRALESAVTAHRAGEAARAHALLGWLAARRGEDPAPHLLAASGRSEQHSAHVAELCTRTLNLTIPDPKEATWQ